VDHTSDINLTYSEIAKQNLLREGISMDRVFNIGSPMLEVLDFYADKINKSDVVSRFGLEKGRYFVLSSHREENVDNQKKLEELAQAIQTLAKKYDYPIIFSVHPRTEKRLQEFGVLLDKQVIKAKPLGFTDYIALQKNSFCVLSDSGTITEESEILGFPALNLRETHERLEGMEKAAVIMTGFSKERILDSVEIMRRQYENDVFSLTPVIDYHQSGVSQKVLRIIVSYTDYINSRVWFK